MNYGGYIYIYMDRSIYIYIYIKQIDGVETEPRNRTWGAELVIPITDSARIS